MKMQPFSPDGSRPAQAVVVSLVTIAALGLLGLVLAYWTWAWFAPEPEAQLQPVAPEAGRLEVAYDLFGGMQPNRDAVPKTGVAIRLLGVMAADGGGASYAVLQLEAGDIIAAGEGMDIAPGIRLRQVDTDHVVLERGGARETLAWPEQGKAAMAAAPTAAQ